MNEELSYEEREIIRKLELKEKVEKATKELIDSLNIMGREDEVLEALFEIITHTHRTLQANFIRTIKGFLEKYSKLEYFDARNQGAVEYAKLVARASKESFIPFI